MTDGPKQPTNEQAVEIHAGTATLRADLVLPGDARGLVIFAHGSGSGRKSERNRAVAAALQREGFATLLLDLLSAREEEEDAHTGRLRFDIALLSERLVAAVEWARQTPHLLSLPIGLFGASTGAAAALVAASRPQSAVSAVVSRGGRPDLAGEHLTTVRAPVLLIVGERDTEVIALNRQAMERLKSPTEIVIIPRATHLFPEPGALDAVFAQAREWFARHLRPVAMMPESRTGLEA